MSTGDSSRPGFWRRLGRAFVGFLKFLIFAALVAAIAAGAWIGYRELQRALQAADDLAERNAQEIALLRSDLDNVMADTSEEEAITDLEQEIEALQSRVDELDSEVEDELIRQSETLDALQEQMDGLSAQAATREAELATLRRGVAGIQEDVNANAEAVDGLGGDVDELDADVGALSESFARVREDAGELAQMRRALTLFRAWELVARARLRLLQGNAGLAAGDLTAAQATLGALATEEGETATALAPLRQRLALALENLPADPVAAGRDLETAWEMLDEAIATLSGGPVAGPQLLVTPALTATGTITATATPTVTPVLTPTAAPAATATPGS